MSRTTIVMDDDIQSKAKTLGINVSETCRDAVADAISRAEALAKYGEGMEHIEVWIDDPPYCASFVGQWIIEPDENETRFGDDAGMFYGAAVTGRGRIAIYAAHINGKYPACLWDYDDLDEAAQDVPALLLAHVADLGFDQVRPVPLDI